MDMKRRGMVRLVVTGLLALAVFLGTPGPGAVGGTMPSSKATVSSLSVHPRPMTNGVIAFVAGYANASLNAIDPTSGRLRSLAGCATVRCAIVSYHWSPNGKRIFFVRGRLGSGMSVFVVNANGGGEKRLAGLTSIPGCGTCGYALAWAPDGAHLAIDRGQSLYVLNLKTGQIRRLFRCAFSPCWDMDFAWSPDGSKIAFARSLTSCTGACQGSPWVVNADGSGARKLSDAVGRPHPLWSPDGRTIAFSGSKADFKWVYHSAIYTVNPDGSHLRLLVPAPTTDRDRLDIPAGWSPDGRHILYLRFSWPGPFTQATALWVMNANGTGRRRLYGAGDGYNDVATWSPDGRLIAFSNGSGLYLMDANGTHVHRLLAGSTGGLAWQPVP